MKKLLLSFGTVLFLFSCSKESATTITETVVPKSLQAKVDGASFSCNATYYYSTFLDTSYNIAANYLDGNTNVSTSFSISFFGDTIGTYPISSATDAVANASYSYGPFSNSVTYTAQSGTLYISKIDTVAKKISGTFNFVAKDASNNTKTITEGKLVDVAKF